MYINKYRKAKALCKHIRNVYSIYMQMCMKYNLIFLFIQLGPMFQGYQPGTNGGDIGLFLILVPKILF